MKGRILTVCLAVLIPLTVLLGLTLGAADIAPAEIIRALINKDTASVAWRVTVYVRLPRIAAALMAGAALACAGCMLQNALANPLASPGVIGVNSGAGLGAVAAMILIPARPFAVPMLAFGGAFFAAVTVYFLSRAAGGTRGTVILSGVAVSSALTAIIDALISLVPDAAADRAAFTMGSFAGATVERLTFAAPAVLIGLCGFFLLKREMGIIALGDENARGLGVNAQLFRFIFIALAAMLSGAAVSFAGLIGFVGLIAPHAVRLIAGNSARNNTSVPLLGAEICLLCDILARTLFAPYEISVGIVLSVIGAPMFIFLLFRRGRELGR